MDNTSHILDEIDHAVSELKVQKWTATLPFNGCLCLSTDDVVMASFQDCHDLFSFTSTLHKGFILRFDPQTFPAVPGGVAKNKASIKKLFDVLMCASHHHGFCQLVSQSQSKTGRKYLFCLSEEERCNLLCLVSWSLRYQCGTSSTDTEENQNGCWSL
ncbi:hypothetical protein IV203_027668 [Nitzschia inconspicua]|uniref:Uncharacterized protein n=1 Tax=Nitzschia inconspicua TaxID=303405 RepID=A0A9K3LXG4_9STRA|nr:hypothetical protein IV203_027668 [Nitzschia inconspicua]